MILNRKRVSFKHSTTLKCTVLWKELLSDQGGEQEARQQALPPLQPCTQWAAFVHTQRKAVCVKTVDTLLCSNYIHTIGFKFRSKCQLNPSSCMFMAVFTPGSPSGFGSLVCRNHRKPLFFPSVALRHPGLSCPRCFRLSTAGMAC